jgi:mRNA interferase HicA
MRIPMLKPREVVRILKRAGFEELRQIGSHLAMGNRKTRKVTTVPIHSGDIKRSTLREIIKQSGLSVEEFLELL